MSALTISGLNNGRLDLDHIAEVATSTKRTAKDRLGNVKLTLSAAIDSLKGFNPRGAWTLATDYEVKDVFTSGGIAYATVVAHKSISVAADLVAGNIVVHQGATKEDLGGVGGSAMVRYGVDTVESELARLVATPVDLTANIQLGSRVVVECGDSLVANPYLFAGGLLPGGFAYDNPYGLQAWGHLLRDSIYASTLPFTFATAADIEYTSGVARYPNINPAYTAPFNANLETFTVASPADEIHIRTNYVASKSDLRLLFFTGARGAFPEIAKFDIYADDVFQQSVDLAGDPEFYRGAYQLNIDTRTGTTGIVLKNIRRSNGAPGVAAVQIIGFTVGRVDVHMTSHGGWTSGDILEHYDALIGRYAPDDLFLQLGANDLGKYVPVEVTVANLEGIIVPTRTARPNGTITLITTTPMDEFPLSGAAGQQRDAMRALAGKYGCYFVDLYDVLGKMSPAQWRHDNVHTTIQGGNYIYQAIRNKVFPSMRTPEAYFARAEYQILPTVPTPLILPSQRKSRITVRIDAIGNPDVAADDQFYVLASTTPDGLIVVVPRGGSRILSVEMVVNNPTSRYYVGSVKAILADGTHEILVLNILNDPRPAVVTSKIQLADAYFVVYLG